MGRGLSSLLHFWSSTLVKNWITVLPNDCQVGDVFGEVCLGWVDHLQIPILVNSSDLLDDQFTRGVSVGCLAWWCVPFFVRPCFFLMLDRELIQLCHFLQGNSNRPTEVSTRSICLLFRARILLAQNADMGLVSPARPPKKSQIWVFLDSAIQLTQDSTVADYHLIHCLVCILFPNRISQIWRFSCFNSVVQQHYNPKD